MEFRQTQDCLGIIWLFRSNGATCFGQTVPVCNHYPYKFFICRYLSVTMLGELERDAIAHQRGIDNSDSPFIDTLMRSRMIVSLNYLWRYLEVHLLHLRSGFYFPPNRLCCCTNFIYPFNFY